MISVIFSDVIELHIVSASPCWHCQTESIIQMTFFSHHSELSDGKPESVKSDRRLAELSSVCGN